MKYIESIFACVIGILIGIVIMVCLFTPDKTKYGEYTDPIKYWFDNQYFSENF